MSRPTFSSIRGGSAAVSSRVKPKYVSTTKVGTDDVVRRDRAVEGAAEAVTLRGRRRCGRRADVAERRRVLHVVLQQPTRPFTLSLLVAL